MEIPGQWQRKCGSNEKHPFLSAFPDALCDTLGHLQKGETWWAHSVLTALRHLFLWILLQVVVILPALPHFGSSHRPCVRVAQLRTQLRVPVQFKQPLVLISNTLLLYFSVADIDECASDSHQCNPTQICINTEGGYTCSCTEGYWLLEGQCLGKNLMPYKICISASVFVCLWIAEITSLSVFVNYRVKALAAQKLMSSIFTSANSTLAERLPHGTKM